LVPEPEPVPDLAADVPQEIEVQLPVAPAKKKTASSKAVEKTSSYERIQSPGGKVYYRKVQ
jgi:hypothetical protein